MSQAQSDAMFTQRQAAEPASAPALPSQIGPFKILGVLGEGAMGRVYRAEQDEPRRQVALKVMRTVGASNNDLARFRREVELLAELEHPGIARLYTAGTAETATGPVPYLAMECVQGLDVAAHAERAALDTAARLALVAALCRIVHHAHSRGVIHRDLKPSNILVTDEGQVKVLDFGIARALQNERHTEMTQAGQVMGTLQYMSWEQLHGQAGALDPRSDVYALGVIAYQLLSRKLPYQTPPEPTLISVLEQRRHQDPAPLSTVCPALKGDVHLMVMKALAREPEQRYLSAAEMAADIERYLSHQPITAQAPTASYLMGLFVRRHRTFSVAALAVLVAIVMGSVVSLRFAVSESRARQEADRRASEAEAVTAFIRTMFTSIDPDNAKGTVVTVREMMDKARADLSASDAPQDPVARASLSQIMGFTYQQLGESEIALELLKKSADLRRSALGSAQLETLDAEVRVVQVLTDLSRNEEAAERLSTLVKLPLDVTRDDHYQRHVEIRMMYGVNLAERGKLAEAEAVFQEMMALLKQNQGRGTPYQANDNLLVARHWLANVLESQNKLTEALALVQANISTLQAVAAADDSRLGYAQSALANLYQRLGRHSEAEPLQRQILETRLKTLGEHHIGTLTMRERLARTLSALGKHEEAVIQARTAVAGNRKKLGNDTRDTLASLNVLSMALADAGQMDEALSLAREIQQRLNKVLPADHPDRTDYAQHYAQLQQQVAATKP